MRWRRPGRSCTTCDALRRAGRNSARRCTSIRYGYLQQYPGVAEAIARGDWLCALQHYLCNDTPASFDPLAEFSEAYYLARYPDIAAAVEARERRNGYDHFLNNGVFELRSPNQSIDLQ